MAEVSGVFQMVSKGVLRATWTALANGDTGQPLDGSRYPDKSMTVLGTFGAGGTVILEGGPPGGSYLGLNDTRGEGNALSFTTADSRQVNENPAFIRPRVTAGDGTTALTVVLECSSTKA